MESALDEASEASLSGVKASLHGLDDARWVIAAQQLDQPIAAAAGTFGADLHPAIGEVRRLADQTQFQRPAAGPPAKSDALHLTRDQSGHPDQ